MWVVEALGEVLRSRREQLGMSQAGLAAAAGVSLRQVGRYESGEQQPVLGVALSLAEALGMTLNEMVGHPAAPHNLLQRVDELQGQIASLAETVRSLQEAVEVLQDRALGAGDQQPSRTSASEVTRAPS